MGHVRLDATRIYKYGPDPGGKSQRYDHLFLHFPRPPRRPDLDAGSWGEALQEFIAQGEPEILGTPAMVYGAGDRYLDLYMTIEGERQEVRWYPSQREWEAIVRALHNANGTGGAHVVSVDEAEAIKWLFLHFTREAIEHQLRQVVEAAWALGLLREAARNRKKPFPLASGVSAARRQQLKTLATEFAARFTQLLRAKGLKRILATPWVNNTDWPRVRDDLRAYQAALEGDPAWKRAIRALVAATIEQTRTILGLLPSSS